MSALPAAAAASAAPAGPISLAALPDVLFRRCPEYTSAPVDRQLQLRRHADMPAVYRNGASYLWEPTQAAVAAQLFAPGWKFNSQHSFQLCSGQVRLLPKRRRSLSLVGAEALATGEMAPHVDDDRSITRTVEEQMHTRNFSATARPFVMSDISPYCTTASTAAFLPLGFGPALFQPFNLLTATPPADDRHDHTLAQLNIAVRGTHTNTHTDWYGTDGVIQLTEGEKLWILAPAEHFNAFHALFPANLASFELTDATAATRFQELASLSLGMVVHQRAGDVISVPGGWVHAVVNLTDTASFGYSYLRPWNLRNCIDWARERGRDSALSLVNLDAVFHQTLVKALPRGQANPLPEQAFWGISATQIQEFRAAWIALKHKWHLEEKEAEARAQSTAAASKLASALEALRKS